MASRRPSVSVIVPFYGEAPAARRALESLTALDLEEGDEALMADNTPGQVLGGLELPPRFARVDASTRRSAYSARNAAAGAAAGEWLLFTDDDCRPRPGLLAAYFGETPSERCGAVAGAVLGDPRQDGLVPRYIRSRGHLDNETMVLHPHWRPHAVTANLLVRRSAFEEIGGFSDGVHSGADSELCWRLAEGGWEIDYRAAAAVEHRHRETLGALARQAARDGAGKAWLNRRFPGSMPLAPLGRSLLRCVAGVVVWTAALRFERAAFKAVDSVSHVAEHVGYRRGNAGGFEPPPAPAVALVDRFPPERGDEPAAARLAAVPDAARVEAARRPVLADRAAGRGLDASWLEDEGSWAAPAAAAALAARRPLAAMRARRAGLSLRRLAPRARRLTGGTEGVVVAVEPGHSAEEAAWLARLARADLEGPP